MLPCWMQAVHKVIKQPHWPILLSIFQKLEAQIACAVALGPCFPLKLAEPPADTRGVHLEAAFQTTSGLRHHLCSMYEPPFHMPLCLFFVMSPDLQQ